MSKSDRHITVYEHQSLRTDYGEPRISTDLFEALERYHGDSTPFFKLIRNGVQFNEHVGVIQVGSTLIEVLPKADRNDDTTDWQTVLIGMMQAVYGFDIKSTGHGDLRLKHNSILHLYFEMFIKEVEYLLHTGLAKQYRQTEGNVTALKGRLMFAQQIRHNHTHQERFYVRHTTYDVEHTLHQILYKTLRLLRQINVHPDLHSRIGALLLHFPEMPDLRVTQSTFDRLVFNRKTQHYEKAIDIARLLLLNYHPDVSRGSQNVLALMFDMNKLWEQFVLVSLRRFKPASLEGVSIHGQYRKGFWKPDSGRMSTLQPDIWIEKEEGSIVLDTKWKNIGTGNPSPEDLRQMYVYCDYFEAQKVALIYPGKAESSAKGEYLDYKTGREGSGKSCGVIFLPVMQDIRLWQKGISSQIEQWCVH